MFHFLYTQFCKPLFFLFDAEIIHDTITSFGSFLGDFRLTRLITSALFSYKNERLTQKVCNITFDNPIGLSAGFDYEAKLTKILPSVGFGFQAIGSITLHPYEGNPKPRLGRLPKSRSLLVNKGLKSTGVKAVAKKLRGTTFEIPLGISIAKTNSKDAASTADAIKDYVNCFNYWEKTKIGAYYELNISCPNTFGGEPFTTPEKLTKLLSALSKIKLTKPVFVKLPIDITSAEMDKLMDVIVKFNIPGVIIGNLAKDRTNPALDLKELSQAGKGNFSGKPTWAKSNAHISHVYKKYGKKVVIIGSGGVFSAEDAYYKMSIGATLIELITGMIFEGPQLIGEINRGLVRLMDEQGKKSISEVIGSAHHTS